MTIIEFFSSDPIENAASLITLQPDRVVFLGRSEAMTEDIKKRYTALRDALKLKTELVFRPWDIGSVSAMCGTLKELIAEYAPVRIDLTGGDERALHVSGRVAEQLSDAVPMHRFDTRSGTACEFPSGAPLSLKKPLALSVEQFTALYGDKVAGSPNGQALSSWKETAAFEKAVRGVWQVYVQKPSDWNTQLKHFLECVKYRVHCADPLEIRLDESRIKRNIQRWGTKINDVRNLLSRLESKQVVARLGDLHFRYDSEEAKHCLSKEGNVLEMYTLLLGMIAKNADGTKVFCNAKTGVYFDWNGSFGERHNVHNEVDVMLMRGVCPVFISCKNGDFGLEELFMLRAIAERFGGKHPTAVLVTNGEVSDAEAERTAQMGICLIQQVFSLTEEEYIQKLTEAATHI